MPEASGGQAASDGSRPVPNLILTQDDVSAAEWRTLLDTAGIVTCHWPAFQIEALPDADILTAFDGGADGVVLPSPAAVRVVAQALQRAGRCWPSGVWAGLPGAGSAHAFTRHFGTGPRLLVPPPPYQDAAHLARLVLGAEDHGVSTDVLRMVDHIVRIPQVGAIGSLNVSVAGGILIYEVVRQAKK